MDLLYTRYAMTTCRLGNVCTVLERLESELPHFHIEGIVRTTNYTVDRDIAVIYSYKPHPEESSDGK